MKPAVILAVAALAAGAPVLAQCPEHDGFAGACCATAVPTLPAFPGAVLPGLSICYEQCAAVATPCVRVVLGAPEQVACGAYTAAVEVIDCESGTTRMLGALQLEYTRTWQELAPGGALQVWRFAAKVDLGLADVEPPAPFVVPEEEWPTAFYHGYVDHARDCASGTWQTSFVLAHACDALIHGSALFSSRPGTQHPGRTYALVAPHTGANPFVPSLLPAPVGPLAGEVRTTAAVSGACTKEERLLQSQFTPLLQGCMCGPAAGPFQLAARRLQATSVCGTEIETLGTLDLGLPWFHLMTTSLGTWTTDANFPGPERVWVDEGPVVRVHGCEEFPGSLGVSVDVMYGATTSFGFPVVADGAPPPVSMTDLAGNFSWLVGDPLSLPIHGHAMPTRRTISLSMP